MKWKLSDNILRIGDHDRMDSFKLSEIRDFVVRQSFPRRWIPISVLMVASIVGAIFLWIGVTDFGGFGLMLDPLYREDIVILLGIFAAFLLVIFLLTALFFAKAWRDKRLVLEISTDEARKQYDLANIEEAAMIGRELGLALSRSR